MSKWPVLLLASFLFLAPGTAQAASLQLPAPDTKGGAPLMQTLDARKSSRNFTAKPLSDKLLGDLLWAACGVNRPDGRRTIPTALNRHDIEIYVLRGDGAWRYDATGHTLEQVSTSDLRRFLGGQTFAREAPATLLYVSDAKKNSNAQYAALHTGSAYQNVGLFCASVGLNNVVRASYDAAELASGLGLPESKRIIISQTIGWGE